MKFFLIYFSCLFFILVCKGQNSSLSIGDVYSGKVFLKKYEKNSNDYLVSKKLALFFNVNTDLFIDKGGALLNSSSMSFQELFLEDKGISYLIITNNNIITDTLKVSQGLDYSYNLQTNLKEKYQSVISLGVFHLKEEYYEITKLLGVNKDGKLIKLNSNTQIYDCPIPNKYITDEDSGDFTFGIKGGKRYKRFWNEESNKDKISNKWFGIYHGISKESKDWREEKSISLSISKDSIIYEIAGYQMYQKYLLTGREFDNKLLLSYSKYLDGSESAVLEKTRDFGIIYFDGKKYLWESPYLDFYYDNKQYILNKDK